ncbi:MAG: hypothetical protein JNK32_10640 [Anaerolineales bacterium]|nr:hypothetical protein [Anaerolineales bacterium]
MSDENKVQASNNSNAVGSIAVGGDVSENIHVGNECLHTRKASNEF